MIRVEHPNPIFKRNNWQNLNGEWDFEIDQGCSGVGREFFKRESLDGKIIVPFVPESVLSGVHTVDFMNCVWYARSIELKNPFTNGRVLLHFGAVDYKALVYLNGNEAGRHEGGYTSFCFDITDHVVEGGNKLMVCAVDDCRNSMQPSGKQSTEYHSAGCHYTRSTGIWQTVWLEYVPRNYIKSVKYYPDCNNCLLQIEAEVMGGGTFTAEAFYEGKNMGKAERLSDGGHVTLTLPLAELHLWEAGHGRLYDLTLAFGDDTVESYFGMRSLRLDGSKFLINGKSVFQRLVLDQGFYPDGIYTAKSEEDLEKDIDLSLAAGFNGARLHQKIFEPRFLYHCDKKGYLVWGEHASWGLDHSNPKALAVFLKEWMEAVNRDFNHPSIIGWCPFNETWDYAGRKQDDELLKVTYLLTKQMDKTRPCIDTSGNFHVMTDIFDVHDYSDDPTSFKENYDKLREGVLHDRFSARQSYHGEPTFVSEYGGIQWDTAQVGGWGYGNAPKTEQEFLERYRGLTEALLFNEKMFGFCYTQLYDVEQEVNGLYTYDRQPKFNMELIRQINSQKAAIEE